MATASLLRFLALLSSSSLPLDTRKIRIVANASMNNALKECKNRGMWMMVRMDAFDDEGQLEFTPVRGRRDCFTSMYVFVLD
jgi:hypothetical protein